MLKQDLKTHANSKKKKNCVKRKGEEENGYGYVSVKLV